LSERSGCRSCRQPRLTNSTTSSMPS
jgi:hypothetical protein